MDKIAWNPLLRNHRPHYFQNRQIPDKFRLYASGFI